ncbi:MAG: cell wall hydrolase [Eubacterium sp.]|nr:cell wall hydrolase [Eubacterium sp.]
MNRRTELKLESAKIYLKKNILSGRYKVRNTLAVLTAAALVGTVGITVKAVTDKGDVVDNKSVSAMVAVNTQEAEKPETEYVINLSDDAYLADGSIDTLKGRLDDSDAVLAEANSADNLTSSENDMTGKFIVTTEGLNLRKETSSDANILTVLNTGDYGDVIKTEGEWTFVAFCDKQGYLKTDYIITDDKATEVAEKAAKEGKTYRDVIGVEEVVPTKVAETTTEQTTEVAKAQPAETTSAQTETQQTTQVATQQPTTEATTQQPTTEATTQQPTTEATTAAPVQASSSDLYLLAAIVYAEAGGESYEGQLAVASVVMNRLANGYWGGSLSSVIYAPSQFTGTYSGAFSTALTTGGSSTSLQAAQDAMNGANNVGGYMYFRPTWNTPQSVYDSGNYIQIGNHIFY